LQFYEGETRVAGGVVVNRRSGHEFFSGDDNTERELRAYGQFTGVISRARDFTMAVEAAR